MAEGDMPHAPICPTNPPPHAMLGWNLGKFPLKAYSGVTAAAAAMDPGAHGMGMNPFAAPPGPAAAAAAVAIPCGGIQTGPAGSGGSAG